MDYNLAALNPRDFQHMIQSIARKYIAAGVTAFGDGRDGNRDITYSGKMSFPSATDSWSGYLIGGCKFHQTSQSYSPNNTRWAIRHLESDLKKFTSKRKIKKPDYYLFITNVALSAVADSGGRDQVTKKLESYAKSLGLKSFAIWDYNDIRTFLDGDADIRAAYGHFITSGDVLAEISNHLAFQRPDFLQTMHLFLQKELIADTSAKLQSAGEDPELQIPLANVFVDLPFADTAEAALIQYDEEEGVEQHRKVVKTLLRAGSAVLRQLDKDRDSKPPARARSRYVIVGGPGQGKSTFGQYLCQLHRAALLRDRPAHLLDQRASSIISQLSSEQDIGAGLPVTRRFPIRVELRSFAHALAKSTSASLTLFDYIRSDISKLGGSQVSAEDLRQWLRAYPWLLVLDGLDEVPPSSNRSDVMREIDNFRVDAASANSDMLIVATTRPQSYSREFGDDLFTHLYLLPLSAREAIEYGRRLAEARCGSDIRRKDELIRSLEKACQNPATSRLMQSPLQVTIMATLLEDTGEPPQERYRLFAEYYRTIYKRETRRKLLEGILTERQKDIDTIHARVGLTLQSVGEQQLRKPGQPGDIDSALSDEQFTELVRQRLSQIGITEARSQELLSLITDGSLQRLVFLVRPRDGWIRFDIASLKEFMAAEALMDGSDHDVQERLRTIAPVSYWRNVFQFAVGKCFIHREHMLDTLVSICVGLNDSLPTIPTSLASRTASAVLWGSRLALDILSDGTARQHPHYETRFSSISLELLKMPDPETCARLASVYHNDLRALYERAIRDRLGQRQLGDQLGGWQLLVCLADMDVAWAIVLCDERWPSDTRDRLTIVQSRPRHHASKWSVHKFFDLAPYTGPDWLMSFWSIMGHSPAEASIPAGWRSIFQEVANPGELTPARCPWNPVVANLYFLPIIQSNEMLRAYDERIAWHPDWCPFLAAARFRATPTAAMLATQLSWLADHWSPMSDRDSWRRAIPWPLAACIADAHCADDFRRLSTAVLRGDLGDRQDWEGAERRWAERGIQEDDLDSESTDLPFGREIARTGFPFRVSGWSSGNVTSSIELSAVVRRLRRASGKRARESIAAAMLSAITFRQNREFTPSPEDIQELCEISDDNQGYYWIDSLLTSLPTGRLSDGWIKLINWIGSKDDIVVNIDAARTDWMEQFIEIFVSDPVHNSGLLVWIMSLAMTGCSSNTLTPRSLQMIMSQSRRSWEYAQCLLLSLEQLQEHEIRRIVREIVDSPNAPRLAHMAMRVAAGHSALRGAFVAVEVLEVLAASGAPYLHVVADAKRHITDYLTKIPSALQEASTWFRLNLPPGLNGV